MYTLFLANGFKITRILLDPFFLHCLMGATNNFPKAFREVYANFQKVLEKPSVANMQL